MLLFKPTPWKGVAALVPANPLTNPPVLALPCLAAVAFVVSVDVAFHGLASDISSGTAANATNEVAIQYEAS